MFVNFCGAVRTKASDYSGHKCVKAVTKRDCFFYLIETRRKGNRSNKEAYKSRLDSSRDAVHENFKIVFRDLFVK